MRESLARLRDSVDRVRRREFRTAHVENEPHGTVERGGYVDGHRDGMHVRLDADQETQHEVWYQDGKMIGTPRQMAEWETLDVRLFRGWCDSETVL